MALKRGLENEPNQTAQAPPTSVEAGETVTSEQIVNLLWSGERIGTGGKVCFRSRICRVCPRVNGQHPVVATSNIAELAFATITVTLKEHCSVKMLLLNNPSKQFGTQQRLSGRLKEPLGVEMENTDGLAIRIFANMSLAEGYYEKNFLSVKRNNQEQGGAQNGGTTAAGASYAQRVGASADSLSVPAVLEPAGGVGGEGGPPKAQRTWWDGPRTPAVLPIQRWGPELFDKRSRGAEAVTEQQRRAPATRTDQVTKLSPNQADPAANANAAPVSVWVSPSIHGVWNYASTLPRGSRSPGSNSLGGECPSPHSGSFTATHAYRQLREQPTDAGCSPELVDELAADFRRWRIGPVVVPDQSNGPEHSAAMVSLNGSAASSEEQRQTMSSDLLVAETARSAAVNAAIEAMDERGLEAHKLEWRAELKEKFAYLSAKQHTLNKAEEGVARSFAVIRKRESLLTRIEAEGEDIPESYKRWRKHFAFALKQNIVLLDEVERLGGKLTKSQLKLPEKDTDEEEEHEEDSVKEEVHTAESMKKLMTKRAALWWVTTAFWRAVKNFQQRKTRRALQHWRKMVADETYTQRLWWVLAVRLEWQSHLNSAEQELAALKTQTLQLESEKGTLTRKIQMLTLNPPVTCAVTPASKLSPSAAIWPKETMGSQFIARQRGLEEQVEELTKKNEELVLLMRRPANQREIHSSSVEATGHSPVGTGGSQGSTAATVFDTPTSSAPSTGLRAGSSQLLVSNQQDCSLSPFLPRRGAEAATEGQRGVRLGTGGSQGITAATVFGTPTASAPSTGLRTGSSQQLVPVGSGGARITSAPCGTNQRGTNSPAVEATTHSPSGTSESQWGTSATVLDSPTSDSAGKVTAATNANAAAVGKPSHQPNQATCTQWRQSEEVKHDAAVGEYNAAQRQGKIKLLAEQKEEVERHWPFGGDRAEVGVCNNDESVTQDSLESVASSPFSGTPVPTPFSEISSYSEPLTGACERTSEVGQSQQVDKEEQAKGVSESPPVGEHRPEQHQKQQWSYDGTYESTDAKDSRSNPATLISLPLFCSGSGTPSAGVSAPLHTGRSCLESRFEEVADEIGGIAPIHSGLKVVVGMGTGAATVGRDGVASINGDKRSGSDDDGGEKEEGSVHLQSALSASESEAAVTTSATAAAVKEQHKARASREAEEGVADDGEDKSMLAALLKYSILLNRPSPLRDGGDERSRHGEVGGVVAEREMPTTKGSKMMVRGVVVGGGGGSGVVGPDFTPVGLVNQGNTCYQNAVLQLMFELYPKLVYSVLEAKVQWPLPPETPSRKKEALLLTLQARGVFEALGSDSRHFDPLCFVWSSQCLGLDAFSHNDAGEFFTLILGVLVDILPSMAVESAWCSIGLGLMVAYKSIPKDPLYQPCSQIIPAWMVEVNVGSSVESGLAQLCAVKWNTDVNREFMNKEGTHSKTQPCGSGITLASLPDVLVVQLVRFKYDHKQCCTCKDNGLCEFGEDLDMQPYTSKGTCEKVVEDEKEKAVAEVSMYRLRGVLVHHGSAHSGHYYTYIRCKATGLWYKYNDKKVTPWDVEPNLQRECFGGWGLMGDGDNSQIIWGHDDKEQHSRRYGLLAGLLRHVLRRNQLLEPRQFTNAEIQEALKYPGALEILEVAGFSSARTLQAEDFILSVQGEARAACKRGLAKLGRKPYFYQHPTATLLFYDKKESNSKRPSTESDRATATMGCVDDEDQSPDDTTSDDEVLCKSTDEEEEERGAAAGTSQVGSGETAGSQGGESTCFIEETPPPQPNDEGEGNGSIASRFQIPVASNGVVSPISSTTDGQSCSSEAPNTPVTARQDSQQQQRLMEDDSCEDSKEKGDKEEEYDSDATRCDSYRVDDRDLPNRRPNSPNSGSGGDDDCRSQFTTPLPKENQQAWENKMSPGNLSISSGSNEEDKGEGGREDGDKEEEYDSDATRCDSYRVDDRDLPNRRPNSPNSGSGGDDDCRSQFTTPLPKENQQAWENKMSPGNLSISSGSNEEDNGEGGREVASDEQLCSAGGHEDTSDAVPCVLCGECESPGSMLICDACDGPYHTNCLDPVINGIPAGYWFCPDCCALKLFSAYWINGHPGYLVTEANTITTDQKKERKKAQKKNKGEEIFLVVFYDEGENEEKYRQWAWVRRRQMTPFVPGNDTYEANVLLGRKHGNVFASGVVKARQDFEVELRTLRGAAPPDPGPLPVSPLSSMGRGRTRTVTVTAAAAASLTPAQGAPLSLPTSTWRQCSGSMKVAALSGAASASSVSLTPAQPAPLSLTTPMKKGGRSTTVAGETELVEEAAPGAESDESSLWESDTEEEEEEEDDSNDDDVGNDGDDGDGGDDDDASGEGETREGELERIQTRMAQSPLLNEVGFAWNKSWEDSFQRLERYIEAHGDCLVPRHFKTKEGVKLGNWVSCQRYRKGSLSEEQTRRLNEVGFVWNALGVDTKPHSLYRYTKAVGIRSNGSLLWGARRTVNRTVIGGGHRDTPEKAVAACQANIHLSGKCLPSSPWPMYPPGTLTMSSRELRDLLAGSCHDCRKGANGNRARAKQLADNADESKDKHGSLLHGCPSSLVSSILDTGLQNKSNGFLWTNERRKGVYAHLASKKKKYFKEGSFAVIEILNTHPQFLKFTKISGCSQHEWVLPCVLDMAATYQGSSCVRVTYIRLPQLQ